MVYCLVALLVPLKKKKRVNTQDSWWSASSVAVIVIALNVTGKYSVCKICACLLFLMVLFIELLHSSQIHIHAQFIGLYIFIYYNKLCHAKFYHQLHLKITLLNLKFNNMIKRLSLYLQCTSNVNIIQQFIQCYDPYWIVVIVSLDLLIWVPSLSILCVQNHLQEFWLGIFGRVFVIKPPDRF